MEDNIIKHSFINYSYSTVFNPVLLDDFFKKMSDSGRFPKLPHTSELGDPNYSTNWLPEVRVVVMSNIISYITEYMSLLKDPEAVLSHTNAIECIRACKHIFKSKYVDIVSHNNNVSVCCSPTNEINDYNISYSYNGTLSSSMRFYLTLYCYSMLRYNLLQIEGFSFGSLLSLIQSGQIDNVVFGNASRNYGNEAIPEGSDVFMSFIDSAKENKFKVHLGKLNSISFMKNLLALYGLFISQIGNGYVNESDGLNYTITYSTRFDGMDWFGPVSQSVVTLAGLGGIGSYCAFLLSRLRVLNIILYDSDVIEAANMSGQLYRVSDIGSRKSDSISGIMQDFSAFHNVIAKGNFIEDSEASDIMICGFDNMAARKLFFRKWKNHISNLSKAKRKKALFIDGRLSVDEFQIYSLTGDDDFNISKYESEALFRDVDSESVVCSMKQTSYLATMIASCMINIFVNFCSGISSTVSLRTVPYLTSYVSDLVKLNVTL